MNQSDKVFATYFVGKVKLVKTTFNIYCTKSKSGVEKNFVPHPASYTCCQMMLIIKKVDAGSYVTK